MAAEPRDAVWNCGRYKGGTLLTLLRLAEIANAKYDYRIWQSQERIAAETRQTPRSVWNHFQTLLRDGVLTEIEAPRQHNPGTYRLNFERLQTGTRFQSGRPEQDSGLNDPDRKNATPDRKNTTSRPESDSGNPERTERTETHAREDAPPPDSATLTGQPVGDATNEETEPLWKRKLLEGRK